MQLAHLLGHSPASYEQQKLPTFNCENTAEVLDTEACKNKSFTSNDLLYDFPFFLRMDIKVAAPSLELIHYTVDLDEASCGVALSLQDIAFSNSVLLNLPSPGPLLAGYTQYSVKRCNLQFF